jgi:circadian clock protein KaiC
MAKKKKTKKSRIKKKSKKKTKRKKLKFPVYKVKKSKKKLIKKRVSTGIKELDDLISGGLKNESVNLIGGGAGSGKTILSVQFLIDGLKKGES